MKNTMLLLMQVFIGTFIWFNNAFTVESTQKIEPVDQIIRFEHLFFKKLSDNKTLCYAVAETSAGNKAIKTILEVPRWQYLENFKNETPQYIGKLGKDKIIALSNGAIYDTIQIDNQTVGNNTKPILTQKNKDSIVLDITGRSIREFWITLYNLNTKITKTGVASKNKDTGNYAVESIDYSYVTVTPDGKYAWFIKPDDPEYILLIEELEKKAKPQQMSIDNDDESDDAFKNPSINIDATMPKNIKKLIALNDDIAYLINHTGLLYSLTSQGVVNKIDTSSINTIDTIAVLGNELVITNGSTIYRYNKNQFTLLFDSNRIEQENNIKITKKSANILETIKEETEEELQNIEATPVALPEVIAPQLSTQKPGETQIPLTQPQMLSTKKINGSRTLKAPDRKLTSSKKALDIQKPVELPLIETPQPITEKPIAEKNVFKRHYYDPFIENQYDPVITDTNIEYVATEQEELQKMIKPKAQSNQTAPNAPTNTSRWDFIKKSAAAARAGVHGAWQNYSKKASGWFSWYTGK